MISLLLLLAVTGLTLAFYVWRRPSPRRARSEALIFTCLYCLSLGLALRFGGRTYPGIYFPHSSFLNWLLNGNRVFTGVGYDAVFVAWTTDLFLTFSRPAQVVEAVLRGVKWLAVLVAVTIAIYGFYWAIMFERLP